MKFTKNTMILRGGTEVFVLTPAELVTNVTSGHDNKGFAAIFGNGSGYKFLTAFFSVASELRRNEILYLNTRFFCDNGFVETFSEIEYKYDIVCTNYCETQLSRKDIEKALTTKAYSEQIVNRSPTTDLQYADRWKTERRLTVNFTKKLCLYPQIKMVLYPWPRVHQVWQHTGMNTMISCRILILTDMKTPPQALELHFTTGITGNESMITKCLLASQAALGCDSAPPVSGRCSVRRIFPGERGWNPRY